MFKVPGAREHLAILPIRLDRIQLSAVMLSMASFQWPEFAFDLRLHALRASGVQTSHAVRVTQGSGLNPGLVFGPDSDNRLLLRIQPEGLVDLIPSF